MNAPVRHPPTILTAAILAVIVLLVMATAYPLLIDPVIEALDRAPLGVEDMTPEQEAEFAAIVTEYEAGRTRLVPHERMPAALEEIARARGA